MAEELKSRSSKPSRLVARDSATYAWPYSHALPKRTSARDKLMPCDLCIDKAHAVYICVCEKRARDMEIERLEIEKRDIPNARGT